MTIQDAPPGGWNLSTNEQGAIFHRDGTNLWWVGGNMPDGPLPGVVNLPSQEQINAQVQASKAERAKLLGAYNDINKQPVVFYGMAVDQDTNALAGATVHATVTTRTLTQEREEKLTFTTGENGAFTIEGIAGESLTVGLTKKPDYHYAPVQLFYYSQFYGAQVHHPDPNNPVVFTLTKIKQAESLITFERGLRAPATGEPVRLDFTTGEKVRVGGDLIVSIECPELYVSDLKPVPWRMRLEMVEGGFIPAGDTRLEFMFEAPVRGYRPAIDVSYGHEGEGFSPQFGGHFYTVSRNGQHYAKVKFDLTIRGDERGIPFGLQVYVNTNASPVLEVDPELVSNLNLLKQWTTK